MWSVCSSLLHSYSMVNIWPPGRACYRCHHINSTVLPILLPWLQDDWSIRDDDIQDVTWWPAQIFHHLSHIPDWILSGIPLWFHFPSLLSLLLLSPPPPLPLSISLQHEWTANNLDVRLLSISANKDSSICHHHSHTRWHVARSVITVP